MKLFSKKNRHKLDDDVTVVRHCINCARSPRRLGIRCEFKDKECKHPKMSKWQFHTDEIIVNGVIVPGKIPDRVEMQTDPEKTVMNGWTCCTYNGCEIHKLSDYREGVDPDSLPIITGSIQEGDEVLVNIFGSWCRGTVRKDDDKYYVENGEGNQGNICPLDYDIDDRHCWTCSSALNKRAIMRTLHT